MNLGLSDSFKSEFKDPGFAYFRENFGITNVTIERPLIQTEIIPDPNWISGFVDGQSLCPWLSPRGEHF
jgi:hypothetical protein